MPGSIRAIFVALVTLARITMIVFAAPLIFKKSGLPLKTHHI